MSELSVWLKALTPEARQSLRGPLLQITKFPFRVGRESRMTERLRAAVQPERRQERSAPNNDLYLNEPGQVVCVSRQHFLIDRQEDSFVLVDLGSHCGTIVEGESLRGPGGASKTLSNNDVIVVGPSESAFVFKFVIQEDTGAAQ